MSNFRKILSVSSVTVIVLTAILFITKKDHTEFRRNADHVRFHFDSWLPKLMKVAAVTMCQDIYFAEKQEELSPSSLADRTLFRHEFEHVMQCEDKGKLDYYLGYHASSVANFFRYWDLQKAYRQNGYERVAYTAQYKPLEPWMWLVIGKYYAGK